MDDENGTTIAGDVLQVGHLGQVFTPEQEVRIRAVELAVGHHAGTGDAGDLLKTAQRIFTFLNRVKKTGSDAGSDDEE